MEEISEIYGQGMEENLLFALNEAVANVANKDALFQLIFEILKPVFRFDLGIIQLYSEDRKYLEVFLPGISVPVELMRMGPRRSRISVDELLFPLDENSIRRLQLKDVPESKKKDKEFTRVFEEVLGIDEMVDCPLLHSGRCIGHMSLANGRRGRVGDSQLPLLKQVSRVVAAAVVNTVAFEKLSAKERDTESVLRFTTGLMSRQNFDGFLLSLAEGLSGLRSYDFFSLSGDAWEGKDIACASFDGKAWRYSSELSVPWVSSLESLAQGNERVRLCFLEGEALLDAYGEQAEVLELLRRYGLEAAVLVRLVLGDAPDVVLFIGGGAGRAEGLQNMWVFEQAAPQLLLAMRALGNWQRIQVLQERLRQENRALYEEISAPSPDRQLMGESAVFRRVLGRARQVAVVDTTVLLLGETGTGKEVMARFLHDNSLRNAKPMVRVNCASLPAQLIESELFGYEKGAFTGAVEQRIGKFELAQGGTIFLDEIGELPLEAQSKLLRVLQERELERVGGKEVLQVDVRVIAATNRDLEEEVRKGCFRSDLYFRLNVFPITLPPLRERLEDIPLLADAFLRRYAKRFGRLLRPLSRQEGELLQSYAWPGNVRELEHLMERAAISAHGSDPNLREFSRSFLEEEGASVEEIPLLPLEELIRQHIVQALRRTGGKVSGPDGAAALLGINGKTLDSKMRKYGIQRKVEIV